MLFKDMIEKTFSENIYNRITNWSGMSYSIERMPWGGLQIVVTKDV